jgi:hypothetical protein
LPIFIASCAKSGCHDAITNAGEYDLSSYTKIVSKGLIKYNSASSDLYAICISGEMPPSSTPLLDSTQLSFIRRWIDKGAPNDTNYSIVCETSKYAFATGIAPIFTKYCNGCHASLVAAISGGGIVLDNYSGVLIPVQKGRLLGALNHTSGYSPMPKGGKKISDCQITQVQKWIAAGAHNN